MTVQIPGEVFTVFMNLHLTALKLIQLLTDGSLRGHTHAHKYRYVRDGPQL